MPIIKERIKFENQDINLKISLGGDSKVLGYQQEIDNLTEEVKIDLTNPIIDNEVRRFQYGGSAINLLFYFTANGTTYVNGFGSTGAKFTTSQINDNALKIRNSFFIMDFYDNFNDYTQTKIFTIYQTQILDGKENSSGIPIPKYRIYKDTVSQFYSWYIPKKFINENIEIGATTITAYVKFSFYTARYGKVRLFYNYDNRNLTTPEKMYFKVILNLNNMTWKFDDSGNQKAYQLPISNAYSDRVNDTVENFDNKQQDYPEGNVFDSSTGDYETE